MQGVFVDLWLYFVWVYVGLVSHGVLFVYF